VIIMDTTFAVLTLGVLLSATPTHAQDLAGRVSAAPPDATVQFAFATRPDVCGDGETIWIGPHDDRAVVHMRSARIRTGSRAADRDLEERCENGPVRVSLERRAGAVHDARVEVGGPRPDDGHDLGTIEPADAAAYLLDTLAPTLSQRAAGSAMFAATLARDVETWPALLRLARDDRLEDDVRRQATFWVGQAAAERAAAGLADLVDDDGQDLELRRTALFSLAQRNDESSFGFLLETARNHPHRELRKAAIFWLGQTDDPRALALFEEILVRR
jgi:HEAT repeats